MAVKIKKSVPVKPISSGGNLLDFIRQDQKVQAKKDKDKKKDDAKTFFNSKRPSVIGYFVKWKHKKIEDWSEADFVGYYLNLYLEKCNEEDIGFCNRKSNYKFYIEKNTIKGFQKLYFENDNIGLKKYIEFMIDWWLRDDSFVDGYPNFNSIFSKKPTFCRIYKEEINKFNKKKVVKKRKDIDNDFASKDIWDSYFEKIEN